MSPTVTLTPVVAGAPGPVTVLLGSAAAAPTAEGGWAVINRPKNVGFTAWEGQAPYQMDLNVMFDGFANGVSQQASYDTLHQMMRTRVGLADQPSPVRLSGPVPMTNLVWVIQAIAPETTSIVRGEDGQLLRIEAVLTLVEYVEADVLVSTRPSPAARLNEKVAAVNGSAPAGRTYTVKVGDTLWGIAQKELGAGKRYTEIASLNSIRDPNRVPVGTVLKLP